MEPKDVRKIIDAGGTMKHTPWITLGDVRKARCPFCGSTKICKHYYWDNGSTAAFVGFEKKD
jgi:hypothetical protein